MSQPNDEELEQMLADILSGEMPANSQEVLEMQEESPKFARQLKELRGAADSVSDALRDERAVLMAAAKLDSAPGEDASIRALRELEFGPENPGASAELDPSAGGRAHGAAPKRPAFSRQRIGWVAAAALLLALLMARPWETAEPQDVWMGDGALQLLVPSDDSWSGTTIRCSTPEPAGTRFEITIAADETSEPLASSGTVVAKASLQPDAVILEWTLTTAQKTLLPPHGRILIRVFGAESSRDVGPPLERWVTLP